jgi:hypothetical protein
MSGAGASDAGGDFRRRCLADKHAPAECQERLHKFFDQMVVAKRRRVDDAAVKVRANNASSSRDSAPASKLARRYHSRPCPSDSGSDSGSDRGRSESEESDGGAVAAAATPAAAAPPPAAAPQAAKKRVTELAFNKAKKAHAEWTGYEHTLSEIYKGQPQAIDMLRARRKLREFEAIMREYHRAHPPLALHPVKLSLRR